MCLICEMKIMWMLFLMYIRVSYTQKWALKDYPDDYACWKKCAEGEIFTENWCEKCPSSTVPNTVDSMMPAWEEDANPTECVDICYEACPNWWCWYTVWAWCLPDKTDLDVDCSVYWDWWHKIKVGDNSYSCVKCVGGQTFNEQAWKCE